LEYANILEAKLLSVESIKEFIVGQKQENRNAKKKKYDISSSSFQSFWEKLVKPEKKMSQSCYKGHPCCEKTSTGTPIFLLHFLINIT